MTLDPHDFQGQVEKVARIVMWTIGAALPTLLAIRMIVRLVG